VPHVLLEEVDHARHLRINEHAVTAGFESGQKAVEDVKLSGIGNERLFV
jgi:hypothetical protein